MSKIKSLGGQMPQMPLAATAKPAAVAETGASDSAQAELVSTTATSIDTATNTSSPEQLDDLVAQIQSKVAAFAPGLEFSVDQLSGKSVIKVTDTATNDVVWQFPSVAAIQISKELDQFQKGVLINRRV